MDSGTTRNRFCRVLLSSLSAGDLLKVKPEIYTFHNPLLLGVGGGVTRTKIWKLSWPTPTPPLQLT